MNEADWLSPSPTDQRTLFEGNSILRGGREPHIRETRQEAEQSRAGERGGRYSALSAGTAPWHRALGRSGHFGWND
jgi:hypothetical protein